ncbi:uncharacterized protein N7515_007712 [Penicillium bovifimosum]|uniref:Uncharacterized protein n=1 Tax=Penicillium bovifimosum TaxID=126998 RepID=A0A9W9GMS4_9EURO|nr:uncharacterized protein N7515_007712 [Penicillium bovifimosum]KAJ5123887.1 hypothetical protein N7515_007712 [Penicillium bovifimosum]
MSDPRLVDMEPGGESTQYESIREFTKSPPRATGQLGGGGEHSKSQESPSLGTHTPASTNDDDIQAQKLGMGVITEPSKDKQKHGVDEEAARTRRAQGYGPGSGVGA